MGLFDFVKKVVNDVKNTAKEVTDKVTDTVKYVANKAKDIATDIFGKKEEQKVIVKETESIVKRDDERKAALEAEKAKYKADLEKARLDHETEKSRLENERLAKQDELDHQKRLPEIEKEKLTSILAAGTATQQQITKQKELARVADENARSEAESC
ncbi:hypothetical protein WR25_25100 [Diploscapter pachys]|uniref:Uncharacterized protein n=1 Tax=Diploscapter pachys TaxID=2018661 RepID=A0A2A2K5E4_9BILA|nr:hypothetical protein WR25_25100 [Diploscapter pachys]